MTDLVFNGAPVAFPAPDDFPSIGHWTAAQVAANVEPLRAAAGAECKAVARWLGEAAAAGRGVVGFYVSLSRGSSGGRPSCGGTGRAAAVSERVRGWGMDNAATANATRR